MTDAAARRVTAAASGENSDEDELISEEADSRAFLQ